MQQVGVAEFDGNQVFHLQHRSEDFVGDFGAVSAGLEIGVRNSFQGSSVILEIVESLGQTFQSLKREGRVDFRQSSNGQELQASQLS